jgi:hypothetical protein
VLSDAATATLSLAPEVAITSPANGAVGVDCLPAVIEASATDPDGQVVSVEFFAEGLGSIGIDTDGSDGWSLTLPNPAPGTYLLTAVAVDNDGVSCSSEGIIVTVLANTPPVAVDGGATTPEEMSVDIVLEAMDAQGGPLEFSLAGAPANGTASLSGNVVTYTPAPNFNGPDSFTFTATDFCGAESAAGTVSIMVLAVNDPPVCTGASATTAQDTAVAITLPASDPDGDPLTFTASNGANGTVSVSGNVATYTPAAGFTGPDTFSYTATDPAGASVTCTVSVTVNGGNEPPVAVIDVQPQVDLGDNVVNITLISANGENVCAILDGTGSFDADDDSLTYLWFVDGVPVGEGAIVEACLPVGSLEVMLVVNDGQADGTATVQVDVLSGSEAVEELVLVVNDSIVERKNKRPFLASLKAAAASFDRGSLSSGPNQLKAFQNKTRAQIGRQNPDVADEWIRIAQEIMDAIDQSADCEACQP